MDAPDALAVVHERHGPPTTNKQHLLDEARKHLSVIDSYKPEVEYLLKVVSGRVKTRRVAGVPAHLRKLEREREVMRWALAELGNRDLDGEALKIVERKVVASATVIQHEAIHWDVLKRCRSLVVLDQTFQGSDKEGRRKEVSQISGNGRDKQQLHRTLKEQSKVDVDVVEGGREWIDIRWLQADRLARQMADSGWGWGEYDVGDHVDPSEWEDMPLAKQVKRLVAAARINRHEYRIPRVRIVMPNLSKGVNGDIDVLLDQLTRLDSSVEVAIEDATSEFLKTPTPDLETAVKNLLGDEKSSSLTDTLNLDHTILIDLISDITHSQLEPQPWQAPTTRAQIEEEISQDGVMARTLYPILQDRILVCTQEAAEHFHEVLKTVGTATERERGRLLVPDEHRDNNNDAYDVMTPLEIRQRFQELSTHHLPPSLQIPIRILRDPWTLSTVQAAVSSGTLPPVALDVARCGNFKSSKLSIYMHGWASGITTVTSNKEIRGQIRTWVEANRKSDEETGPMIWRVEVTRNLLAKSAVPPPGFLI